MMDTLTPTSVRYIKLGPGCAWVPHCVASGEIQFGYAGEPFDLAAVGDWDGIVAHYVRGGRENPQSGSGREHNGRGGCHTFE